MKPKNYRGKTELTVYEPTDKFLNFIQTNFFSYSRDDKYLFVYNYKIGSYLGVIGINAKAFIDGKWRAI